MARWFEHELNRQHVERIRGSLGGGGRVLVFLGAGLSFGAARQTGRARFDNEHWGADPGGPGYRRRAYDYPYGPDWPPLPPYQEIAVDDDGLPVPSWPWLISRMRRELAKRCHEDEQESLSKFFRDQGPLDCAQLFRQTVGEANYREFLQAQFDVGRHEFVTATPSHEALVALGLPLVFTTNYDELIEHAHIQAGLPIRVSADEEEFKAHISQHPARHLVKLHGSVNRPATMVLTRDDYSRARSSRREMLAHLRHEMANSSLLFVGFSLSDPNFNLLHDDIRESLGMLAPVSYTVQGGHDPVKERYHTSLGVNTVWLDGWNDLPGFWRQINPPPPTATSTTAGPGPTAGSPPKLRPAGVRVPRPQRPPTKLTPASIMGRG
jgi:hypothetical protein